MAHTDSPVKVGTVSWTIKDLVEKLIYTIDLDADYQREKIWSTSEQRLLLDSILKDIDIPKLYLAKTEDDKQFEYECIDGKQRMMTLLAFMKPQQNGDRKTAVTLPLFNRQYSYVQLKRDHPTLAEKIEDYKLDFVIYDLKALGESERDQLISEIFRRLQLGLRLNSGERLKAIPGTIRDFVFNEMGRDAPFLRNTTQSDKRFSRQFTLSQICLLSFKHAEIDEFVRARLQDLEDFFIDNSKISSDDRNLVRIRTVLGEMDSCFGARAASISSRAVAVSAYLFVEDLYLKKRADLMPDFASFYIALLGEIRRNMELVNQYNKPENIEVMDGFQKHILQASVEPAAIRRRQAFLERAFARYTDPTTKGQLVGVTKSS